MDIAHYTSTASPLQKHVHYPCFTLSDAVIYNVVLEEHWHLPTIVNRRTDIKREYFQGSRSKWQYHTAQHLKFPCWWGPGSQHLDFQIKSALVTSSRQPGTSRGGNIETAAPGQGQLSEYTHHIGYIGSSSVIGYLTFDHLQASFIIVFKYNTQ